MSTKWRVIWVAFHIVGVAVMVWIAASNGVKGLIIAGLVLWGVALGTTIAIEAVRDRGR